MPRKKCNTCRVAPADPGCRYKGRVFCRPCAHNFTHSRMLRTNELPAPVIDQQTGALIPWGTYPNVDYS